MLLLASSARPMLQRVRRLLAGLGFYALWGVLAALLAWAAYQVYATLLAVGIWVVEHPAIRPAGWNSATITGLSRFLILVLGGLWLLLVSLLESYLREGARQRQLRARVARLMLLIGAVYVVSYAILLLFSNLF
jgi:hypothetical protein